MANVKKGVCPACFKKLPVSGTELPVMQVHTKPGGVGEGCPGSNRRALMGDQGKEAVGRVREEQAEARRQPLTPEQEEARREVAKGLREADKKLAVLLIEGGCLGIGGLLLAAVLLLVAVVAVLFVFFLGYSFSGLWRTP